MGGLLIGHIDSKGNNTVVCGFFPRQDEASSGYCEFHGSFTAIASAACDYANEKAGGDHTPDLRVIGWIHTHPDIGIFLSGIDINTFRMLRQVSFEQRCVAVVVDPIRKEHGVFTSEKRASGRDADTADSKIRLSEDLEARYHKFLNRMRTMQTKKGKEEIPFIMPGLLYQSRKAMGDVDDVLDAKMETLGQLVRRSETLEKRLMKKDAEINSLQADLHLLNVQQKQAEGGKNLIRERLTFLKKCLEEEKQSRLEVSKLVLSLLSRQEDQEKILDSLQQQLADTQRREVAIEDEPQNPQIRLSVINKVASGGAKNADKKESEQVFDPSEQVKPVEESTSVEEKNVNQDE
jgi:proteasome lid subunit RPN8/RPN11